MVKIETEDDENWFEGMSFSSFWLKEFVQKAQDCLDHLEDSHQEDMGERGDGPWGFMMQHKEG